MFIHEVDMSVAHTNSKEELITALCDLACRDNDFTGENGEDYLWDCAKAEGYETNMDYVAHSIKAEETGEIIREFFSNWLDNDGYYDSYEYDYTILPTGEVVIVLSYVHLD